MGLSKKEIRKYTVTGPDLAKLYLLIKIHKPEKGSPGRPVVSQIDDPTYILCKVLTEILNPIDEKAKSFIKNSYHLKELLVPIKMGRNYVLVSFDVTALYPSIPMEKALKVALKNRIKL